MAKIIGWNLTSRKCGGGVALSNRGGGRGGGVSSSGAGCSTSSGVGWGYGRGLTNGYQLATAVITPIEIGIEEVHE